jgi:hypothetical protein
MRLWGLEPQATSRSRQAATTIRNVAFIFSLLTFLAARFLGQSPAAGRLLSCRGWWA